VHGSDKQTRLLIMLYRGVYAKCCYTPKTLMLSVLMLSVILLTVILLRVILLNVIASFPELADEDFKELEMAKKSESAKIN